MYEHNVNKSDDGNNWEVDESGMRDDIEITRKVCVKVGKKCQSRLLQAINDIENITLTRLQEMDPAVLETMQHYALAVMYQTYLELYGETT